MGRYSGMVQEAQRSAREQFGGGGAGAPREFEKVRTSGLDTSSKEAQDQAMAYYQNYLQNINVDLGAKYERAGERRLGSERSSLGARGYGLNSPISAALEQRGQGELQAQRVGEEQSLRNQMQAIGGQGLTSSIGLGRETYGYNPTTWNPNQGGGGGGGGGGGFSWPDENRPWYSPEINQAYEGNTGYGQQAGPPKQQPRKADSGSLNYYEQRARRS